MNSPTRTRGPLKHQRGASLIVVLLILVVVSALGIGGAQVAMMSERSARNDRDMQVAWQAAEAALMDAEFDIRGPTRSAVFGKQGKSPDLTLFDAAGCGTSGTAIGLCALVDQTQAATVKQKWLTADFKDDSTSAPTAVFGKFTAQMYPHGVGVQPVRKPRYIIEPIRDDWNMRDKSAQTEATYMFRVTAMGFGPREDIQAVAQMILRP